MSKRIYTTSFTALALIAGLSIATPAYAQLGGVTGAVNGSLNSSMRSTTDLSTRTRARATTRAKVKAPDIRPDIRTEAPRTNVNVRTGSPVVAYGTTRSGGYHSHGYYGRHTHTHGHAHYYDNHAHGHYHGSGTHVSVHGEFKSGGKKSEKKDAKAVVYSKADLLTFGTPVKSEAGASLGVISSLQRQQDGTVIGVTVGDRRDVMSVAQLTVDGNVLVFTLPEARGKVEVSASYSQ